MQRRISMITLGVRDLARAAAFYEQGFGWKRSEESSDTVIFFHLNGTWLGLYPWKALAEDATVAVGDPAIASQFRGFALAHNVGSKPEVKRLIEEAVAAGATLIKPAQDVFWGGYSGYFADPDGHLWEIAFNPYFWIGPEEEESGPTI